MSIHLRNKSSKIFIFPYYYGAKIGVLGLNGSGKSTLLRIIAGVDKDYLGEVTFSKGYTIGLLEQEPTLDQDKTVQEVIEEGRQDVISLLMEKLLET